jgi:Arc/MetJ family transcription regulator
VRKNLMVDPALLAEVMRLTGATNQSDAVDEALRLSAAHASALRGLRGLRELVGAAPDFDYQET